MTPNIWQLLGGEDPQEAKLRQAQFMSPLDAIPGTKVASIDQNSMPTMAAEREPAGVSKMSMRGFSMPQLPTNPMGEELGGEYQAAMKGRQGNVELLQQQLLELQGKKPEGLEAFNMKAAAQFVDGITGGNQARGFEDNTARADHQKQVNALQSAVMGQQNAVSDDQLAYLRQLGAEKTADRRMQMQLGAQERQMGMAEEKQKRQQMSQAGGLRSQWLSNPVTKNSQEVATAFEKVKAAAADPSAAGDMSLIFGYMKMLDPGSTVREGEFANAQQATGVPDRILNAYNQALKGTRLGMEQRKDFINQAQNVYRGQLEQQNKFDSSITDIAARSGLNPADVVLPLFQQKGDSAPKGVQSSAANAPMSPQDWLKKNRGNKL